MKFIPPVSANLFVKKWINIKKQSHKNNNVMFDYVTVFMPLLLYLKDSLPQTTGCFVGVQSLSRASSESSPFAWEFTLLHLRRCIATFSPRFVIRNRLFKFKLSIGNFFFLVNPKISGHYDIILLYNFLYPCFAQK